MLERFQSNEFFLRRKVLKLVGGAFYIYGPDEEMLFYSKQKAFKLREDIRLYTDKNMSEEILWIQARDIIDFSAAYDVIDSTTGERVGAFRREGWQSMMRDQWTIFDADENPVGTVIEDSGWLAFVRRFLTNWIPQSFYVEVAGREMCYYKQRFNPFVYKLDISFPDDSNAFDKIMGLAGSVLLAAIEERQN